MAVEGRVGRQNQNDQVRTPRDRWMARSCPEVGPQRCEPDRFHRSALAAEHEHGHRVALAVAVVMRPAHGEVVRQCGG